MKSETVRIAKATAWLVLVCTFLAATPSSIGTADAARYLKDIQVLAAPDMEGRGPGTKGIEKASKYIEHRYKSLGLQPAGTDGYLQPFTVTTGAKLKSDNELVAINGAGKQSLKINQDFEPISFSDSGSFTGPVVFAGYGATADEFHYDDYAGLDVKDKIVLVLRYEPESFAAKSGHQGLDASRVAHHQGDQRAQPRCEGDDPGQWQTGRWRRRPADALWRGERAGELRHHARAG